MEVHYQEAQKDLTGLCIYPLRCIIGKSGDVDSVLHSTYLLICRSLQNHQRAQTRESLASCRPLVGENFKLNFLSINRFERKKNIDLAISAFAMLSAFESDILQGHNLADVTLTLAGGYDKRLKENVEYLEELKSLAEREGVSDRVRFVTSCSTAERNALLSECICVLYTPKDEHFGIVPLEGMAAQKPVIACNSGGPVETIVPEITGFLCEPTVHEFSRVMAQLIRDPQKAKVMGKEARRHVCDSFSTKVFGQRLNHYVIDAARRKLE